MAELLGLIGSVIAIAQIAGAAIKLSQSLHRTAHYAGSAEEDMQAFAMDISAFASIIRVAHDSIRRQCEKESNSSVLQFLDKYEILGHLVQQSARIRRHIEVVRPQVQDLRGRLSF